MLSALVSLLQKPRTICQERARERENLQLSLLVLMSVGTNWDGSLCIVHNPPAAANTNNNKYTQTHRNTMRSQDKDPRSTGSLKIWTRLQHYYYSFKYIWGSLKDFSACLSYLKEQLMNSTEVDREWKKHKIASYISSGIIQVSRSVIDSGSAGFRRLGLHRTWMLQNCFPGIFHGLRNIPGFPSASGWTVPLTTKHIPYINVCNFQKHNTHFENWFSTIQADVWFMFCTKFAQFSEIWYLGFLPNKPFQKTHKLKKKQKTGIRQWFAFASHCAVFPPPAWLCSIRMSHFLDLVNVILAEMFFSSFLPKKHIGSVKNVAWNVSS